MKVGIIRPSNPALEMPTAAGVRIAQGDTKMTRQFAANLSNPDTDEEYMNVGNTAEEAEQFGARQVEAEAARGVTFPYLA
jgi:hypothetical protein